MFNSFGGIPVDLGEYKLKGYVEDTYILYLPIKIPGSCVTLPENLKIYSGLVQAALGDACRSFKYIYLSVENKYVQTNTSQKRPGWHVDGYLTEDENYVYAISENTTEYMHIPETSLGPLDDVEALRKFALFKEHPIKSIKPSHLYKLGKCIHRSPTILIPHKRLFVKISFSDEKYNLYGNSVNHLLNYSWDYIERKDFRNTPFKKQ